jgi:Family of unknown function (DUF6477)
MTRPEPEFPAMSAQILHLRPAHDLTRLRRPRLLLAAAVRGLALYRRERDLPRVIADGEPALPALFAAEGALDAARRAGQGGYTVRRHLEVLVALLAELRDAQTN